MSNPLITIGITCYNASDTIGRAIESALSQDWENCEVLVVDDYSSDNSTNVISQYTEKRDSLDLIQHGSNKGPGAARQTLLEHAKGGFIAFFDDDDESDPKRVRTQYQRIIQYEEETQARLVACYASGKRIYPNGYELQMEAIGSKPDVPYGVDVANRLLFYGHKEETFFYGAGTPSCSLMARVDTLKEVGGFDFNFRRVEDVDLAVRLALAGGHFIGCPETLFIQHSTGGQDKSSEKNKDAEIQLAEKYKEHLQSINRYYYAKKWPYVRYYHFCGQYMKMIVCLLDLIFHHPIKTLSHFFQTAPRRFLHEQRMKKVRAL